MQRLSETLAHGGIAILALVFALAFTAFNLALALAREVVSALQQLTYDEDDANPLSFTVVDTTISYSEVLQYAIVAALVVLALRAGWLLTRRMTRVCPECRSYVPVDATICRFCTTELPSESADA